MLLQKTSFSADVLPLTLLGTRTPTLLKTTFPLMSEFVRILKPLFLSDLEILCGWPLIPF